MEEKKSTIVIDEQGQYEGMNYIYKVKNAELYDLFRNKLLNGYKIEVNMVDYLTLYYGVNGQEVIVREDQIGVYLEEQDEGVFEIFNWQYVKFPKKNVMHITNHPEVPFRTEVIFRKRSED